MSKLNGMNRREFVTTALATGVALPFASALGVKPLKAAEPSKGGHLRLALAGASSSDSLDPSQMGDTFMALVANATRGCLTEYMADGTLKPELAESWESSKKATEWRFKLRKGAEFSNGKSLAPEDVIASLNLHRGEQSKSSAKALFADVTDIVADGDQVVVTLSSGNVDFPYLLSVQQFNIAPTKDGQLDLSSGAGAGPYLLKEFTPGVRATLEKNPNCYKSGHVDSAELLGVADATARQAALRSGQTDIVNRLDLKTIERFKTAPGVRIESLPGRRTYWLTMSTKVKPFDNNDVRTALKFGIDREAILKTILRGYGSVGNDQPITPSYRYYNPDLKPRAYDPEQAKFLLKKAGHDSLSINFYTSNLTFSEATDMAAMYQQQSAKAGININIIQEPDDSYWDKVNAHQLEYFQDMWSGRPTEDGILGISMAEGAPWNHSFWDNKEFNTLLRAARGEEDEAKRREMYYRIQQVISDDGASAVPINANNVHAVGTKIKNNGAMSTNFELDGGRCIERWWIEA